MESPSNLAPNSLTNPLFKIVLVEPEIPQNTGNIGRTCVATGCELHLIGPMAFEITDKNLKRAGLDYWPNLRWSYYHSVQEWENQVSDKSRVFYFTTKTDRPYFNVSFKQGDWLVFGKETKGLDPAILEKAKNQTLTIPQPGPVRSLNLATAVAIAAYEGLRQISYSQGKI
ncbi:MAG: tRNA (cytidine(34)-2'-O)-methyltransferase [Bdellovibrionota bacterium]